MSRQDRQVARELAQQAKDKGICVEWYRELRDLTDKRAMVDMYLRGIDFCLGNDFPSIDYIKAHFRGVMEDQGVFLDDEISLTNYRYCVALGSTGGKVRFTDYNVGEVFVKHEAQLTIIAEGNAFVEVDMFDQSEVSVVSREGARVHVNRYGGTLLIDKQGESRVKVVEKMRATY